MTTAKFIADCWKQGKSLAEASAGFIPDAQKTKQNAMCITCMGKGVHPDKSPTGKVYSCPSCQGSGISPFKVAAVKG